MNYTEKYHLPQWEESDRVMRTDFNNAMAALEDGLKTNAQGVSEAKTEAAKLPYVVGTYVGTVEAQDIYLGFQPAMVIIGSTENSNVQDSTLAKMMVLTADSGTTKIRLTDTGFHMEAETTQYKYPKPNYPGGKYQYIAFR